jgi:hypothetical protein
MLILVLPVLRLKQGLPMLAIIMLLPEASSLTSRGIKMTSGLIPPPHHQKANPESIGYSLQ